MYVQPTSEITLYDLTLDVYDGRSPIFTTAAKQAQYFAQHKLLEVPDCKYIKRTGRIRVKIDADEAFNAGYMSFKNKDFEDKVFYAFLGEPHYINNECYEYEWTIDFIQTWMFDVEFSSDFVVDREHLSTTEWDEAVAHPWANTVPSLMTPEDLPISEDKFRWNYNIVDANWRASSSEQERPSGKMFFTDSDNLVDVLYLTRIDFNSIAVPEGGANPKVLFKNVLTSCIDDASPDSANNCGFYFDPTGEFAVESYSHWSVGEWILGGGVMTGGTTGVHVGYGFSTFNPDMFVLGFDELLDAEHQADPDAYTLQKTIDLLTQWGCVSSIMGVYKIPKNIIKKYTFKSGSGTLDLSQQEVEFTLPDPASWEQQGYSPKLLRMPYSYITVNTPVGDTKEYYYEKFRTHSNGVLKFYAICDLMGTPCIRIYPEDYEYDFPSAGYADLNNKIEFCNIPIAPYNIDPYISQYTSIAQSWVSSSTIGNIASRSVAGASAAVAFGTQMASAAAPLLSAGAGLADVGVGSSNINALANKMPITLNESFQTPSNYLNEVINTRPGETPVGGASGVVNAVGAGVRAIIGAKGSALSANEQEMMGGDYGAAARYLAGDGDAIMAHFYGKSLPPAASSIYVGKMDPYTLYSNLGYFNIYSLEKQIRDEYKVAYSNYFKLYGYKSIRIGVPYFANFISNSQNDLPHFDEVDNKKLTYFKCIHGHIHGVPKYVSEAWMTMLEYGMTFLNGDDLITIPT